MKKLFQNKYFVEVLKVLAIFVVIMVAFAFWMGSYGRHGEEISAPDLSGMTADQAIAKLESEGYRWEILDSSRFQRDKKPREILEQDPSAGTHVKQGRKIYLKINRSSYESVAIPRIDFENDKLVNVSKRLVASGFVVGEIIYKPHIAKDVVLGLSVNGRGVSPGNVLPKNTRIDIIVAQSDSVIVDSTLVDDEDF